MIQGATTATLCLLICGCVQNVTFPDADEQRRSFLDRVNEGYNLVDVYESGLSKTLGVFASNDCSDIYVDGDSYRRTLDAKDEKGIGSGAVIVGGKFVVTALHLTEGSKVFCVLGRGENADFRSLARPYWCSRNADLAILRLAERSPHSFDWSARVLVGDVAWTIGIVSPVGGFVTSVGEVNDTASVPVESSLRLTFGDSGSPLISEAGELMAVNTKALAKRRWSPSIDSTLSQRPADKIRKGEIEANCER